MISAECFIKKLDDNNINLFCGVPDSLLKNLISCIEDKVDKDKHFITANEGNAVALAAGYYLSTGKISVVYMQNSGLGNSVNPLASLVDSDVYGIPVVLVIGWRGEPGIKDEPQHFKQGKITTGQLDLLGINYWIIDKESNLDSIISEMSEKLKNNNCPVALIVREGAFEEYKPLSSNRICLSDMLREEALSIILDCFPDDLIISTTGKTSRELYELRNKRKEKQRDFLTVGSMGHTSSIALGVAIGRPDKRVICLDGDGSLLMHMGALPVIGEASPENLIHILLNNSSHESVGGQPTVADRMDFNQISKACGYKKYLRAENPAMLEAVCKESIHNRGPVMIEILLQPGSRKDLGRPHTTPEENKKAFMVYINGR